MGIFDSKKQDEIQNMILQNLQKLNERLLAREQEDVDSAVAEEQVAESQNLLNAKEAEIEALKTELAQANDELQKAKEQMHEMQTKIEAISEKAQETMSEPEKEAQTTENVEVCPAPADDARLKEIEAKLKEIAEKVEFNEYKDKIIKDLHEDLRENKRDYSAELSKPYVNYIIKLHHSLYDLAKRFEKEEVADDNFKKLLREVRNRMLDVQDALEEEFAMQYFEPEVGCEYVPKEHQAIQVIVTDDEALGGKIAEIAYGGFRNLNTDKVFKQAIVRPYRFEKK